MEVRDATADDFEAMRRTAAASMHESYDSFLDPETIDAALDEWYGADTLAAQIEADGALLYVATEDDEVAGALFRFEPGVEGVAEFRSDVAV